VEKSQKTVEGLDYGKNGKKYGTTSGRERGTLSANIVKIIILIKRIFLLMKQKRRREMRLHWKCAPQ
jgi:hypothetical protein